MDRGRGSGVGLEVEGGMRRRDEGDDTGDNREKLRKIVCLIGRRNILDRFAF